MNSTFRDLDKQLKRSYPSPSLYIEPMYSGPTSVLRDTLINWVKVWDYSVMLIVFRDMDHVEYQDLMRKTNNAFYESKETRIIRNLSNCFISDAVDELTKWFFEVIHDWYRRERRLSFTCGEIFESDEFKEKWEQTVVNSRGRFGVSCVIPVRTASEAIHKLDLCFKKTWIEEQRIIFQEATKEAETKLKIIADKEAEKKKAMEDKKKADEEAKKTTECPADIKAILHTVPAKPKGYKDGAGVWRGASKAQIENWEKKYGHLKKWLKK